MKMIEIQEWKEAQRQLFTSSLHLWRFSPNFLSSFVLLVPSMKARTVCAQLLSDVEHVLISEKQLPIV